ncbi:site-2 protease family protein [Rhodothermus bifroesti]|uniref:Site-2 protease family protein n=1 Tax=Rhodothermus marinus TaxID=29549 RepID=A0A7V2B2G8_RHOMR|nr:site-2 protease family protein [Rhodothermus bifroesti]GBD01086.1 hypothetical protein HRbin18_00804 [bacterium HR18]
MESKPLTQQSEAFTPQPHRPQRLWLHLLLFFLTLLSTTLTWPEWAGRWLLYEHVGYSALLSDGLRFSVPLLLILTVHELGHYLAARRHQIDATLPYYIPFPFNGIGTFGAVIRIREPIPDTRTLFDIGVAGPLAGFVVAVLVLLYALITLPPPTYLLDVPGHEALKAYIQAHGRFPVAPLPSDDPTSTTLVLGPTLLFDTLARLFPNVPPMYELYHYPTLFAAWLGLFFTALNLLPVGQLDGGHVLYALFGSLWHRRLARAFMVLLLASATIGFALEMLPALLAEGIWWLEPAAWFGLAFTLYLYLHRLFAGDHRWIAPLLLGLMILAALAPRWAELIGWLGHSGWFLWGLLILYLIRVDHPPVWFVQPLTRARRVLGWIAIAIFVLCFSIRPLHLL